MTGRDRRAGRGDGPAGDTPGADTPGADGPGADGPGADGPGADGPGGGGRERAEPAGRSGMRPLELRYRRVLRLLPASYRAIWADEMVATFMDGMLAGDEGRAAHLAEYGRPSWREVASVAGLAVRLRAGSAGGPARYVAWGRALRLAALIGLLVQSAVGLVTIGRTYWVAGLLPWRPRWPEGLTYGLVTDPVSLVETYSALLWVAAFVALVTGYRRTGQTLALLAPVGVILPLLVYGWIDAYVGYVVAMELVLAVLPLAFYRGAPPVRARRWLIALPVVVVAASAVLEYVERDLTALPLVGTVGLICIAFVVAVAAYPVALRLGRARPGSALPHALALLAPLPLGYQLVGLLAYDQQVGYPMAHRLTVAETVATAIAGIAVTVWTVRALRRLPVAADRATAWTTPS
jgi:hypothetical protein